ncbi:hypothetical protein SGHV038 [Glossina pallidipes salivary gland hypertrophy virus]|uniref:Uncharacterized protein n=1 Tax=Glossina hytrovirus (isolate Glossina pallidipes/Ethiopia/Seibersdorf/-) TaxID=379529 RepID=B0YLJ2_GHVS|nr:hypothetical protein SGHV038 [Glossina pallidipes salivary gland hypertrophy virus]ABQ08811.1 hypothetical protein SGHV038 [Glossina pallidipes salivary gland hypertrophy virus]
MKFLIIFLFFKYVYAQSHALNSNFNTTNIDHVLHYHHVNNRSEPDLRLKSFEQYAPTNKYIGCFAKYNLDADANILIKRIEKPTRHFHSISIKYCNEKILIQQEAQLLKEVKYILPWRSFTILDTNEILFDNFLFQSHSPIEINIPYSIVTYALDGLKYIRVPGILIDGVDVEPGKTIWVGDYKIKVLQESYTQQYIISLNLWLNVRNLHIKHMNNLAGSGGLFSMFTPGYEYYFDEYATQLPFTQTTLLQLIPLGSHEIHNETTIRMPTTKERHLSSNFIDFIYCGGGNKHKLRKCSGHPFVKTNLTTKFSTISDEEYNDHIQKSINQLFASNNKITNRVRFLTQHYSDTVNGIKKLCGISNAYSAWACKLPIDFAVNVSSYGDVFNMDNYKKITIDNTIPHLLGHTYGLHNWQGRDKLVEKMRSFQLNRRLKIVKPYTFNIKDNAPIEHGFRYYNLKYDSMNGGYGSTSNDDTYFTQLGIFDNMIIEKLMRDTPPIRNTIRIDPNNDLLTIIIVLIYKDFHAFLINADIKPIDKLSYLPSAPNNEDYLDIIAYNDKQDIINRGIVQINHNINTILLPKHYLIPNGTLQISRPKHKLYKMFYLRNDALVMARARHGIRRDTYSEYITGEELIELKEDNIEELQALQSYKKQPQEPEPPAVIPPSTKRPKPAIALGSDFDQKVKDFINFNFTNSEFNEFFDSGEEEEERNTTPAKPLDLYVKVMDNGYELIHAKPSNIVFTKGTVNIFPDKFPAINDDEVRDLLNIHQQRTTEPTTTVSPEPDMSVELLWPPHPDNHWRPITFDQHFEHKVRDTLDNFDPDVEPYIPDELVTNTESPRPLLPRFDISDDNIKSYYKRYITQIDLNPEDLSRLDNLSDRDINNLGQYIQKMQKFDTLSQSQLKNALEDIRFCNPRGDHICNVDILPITPRTPNSSATESSSSSSTESFEDLLPDREILSQIASRIPFTTHHVLNMSPYYRVDDDNLVQRLFGVKYNPSLQERGVIGIIDSYHKPSPQYRKKRQVQLPNNLLSIKNHYKKFNDLLENFHQIIYNHQLEQRNKTNDRSKREVYTLCNYTSNVQMDSGDFFKLCFDTFANYTTTTFKPPISNYTNNTTPKPPPATPPTTIKPTSENPTPLHKLPYHEDEDDYYDEFYDDDDFGDYQESEEETEKPGNY